MIEADCPDPQPSTQRRNVKAGLRTPVIHIGIQTFRAGLQVPRVKARGPEESTTQTAQHEHHDDGFADHGTIVASGSVIHIATGYPILYKSALGGPEMAFGGLREARHAVGAGRRRRVSARREPPALRCLDASHFGCRRERIHARLHRVMRSEVQWSASSPEEWQDQRPWDPHPACPTPKAYKNIAQGQRRSHPTLGSGCNEEP